MQYKDTETVGKFVKFVKRESGFSPLGKTGKEATAKTKTMALTKTKSLSPFVENGKGGYDQDNSRAATLWRLYDFVGAGFLTFRLLVLFFAIALI